MGLLLCFRIQRDKGNCRKKLRGVLLITIVDDFTPRQQKAVMKLTASIRVSSPLIPCFSDGHNGYRSEAVYARLYENSKEKQLRDMERREAAEHVAVANDVPTKRISARRATRIYERGIEKKAELERKKEEILLSDRPSFTPVLKTQARHGRDRSRRKSLDPGQRLYSSDHLKKRDERLQIARSEQELTGCTFAPQLVKSSVHKENNNSRTSPVHERLYQHGKELAAMKEASSALTDTFAIFSPDISKSQKTISRKSGQKDIFERLTEQKNDRHSKNTKSRKSLAGRPGLKNGSRIERLYNSGVQKALSRPSTGKVGAFGSSSVFARIFVSPTKFSIHCHAHN